MTRAQASGQDEKPNPPGLIARLLERAIDVRPAEVQALVWAWLYILAVLSSYYILRPIRDQAGVASGVNNLPWLFTGTLVGMLVLNVPFGALVRTLPRTKFIPLAYRFFALNILGFAAAFHFAEPASEVWVGRIFFIWTSIFNLFVVSVFWALIVDVFDSEQGKRLFGFIAAGATVGAIMGSAVTASFAELVPPAVLLFAAAALLEAAVFCVGRLARTADLTVQGQAREAPVGGAVLAGITKTFLSPYLLNTGLFLLLYAITSTILYFEQASIAGRVFANRGAQTAFFATIDLVVNGLTLVIQLFLTGRILAVLGVGLTLALLPALSAIGFAVLAVLPTVASIVGFQILRRAGNFAIARPTREVLFTVVPQEDRYKAKSFIDTVVYRLGDQVGAWSFALVSWFGASLTEVAVIAVPLSLVWLVNALWLGRRQEKLANG